MAVLIVVPPLLTVSVAASGPYLARSALPDAFSASVSVRVAPCFGATVADAITTCRVCAFALLGLAVTEVIFEPFRCSMTVARAARSRTPWLPGHESLIAIVARPPVTEATRTAVVVLPASEAHAVPR